VTPASRRHALVAWARRTGAFIFEDDYDGEFRYAGQPIPALASLDPDVVIYCGTFSKSLFPTWRLGYLVLPQALVEPVARCKWITDLASSRLTQRALAHLLANGEFDRHVRRVQRRYRERRDALVRSLRRHFKQDAEIEGATAGLHLTMRLPRLAQNSADDLIARCRARGVGVYSLARHAKRRLDCATLILGYGLVDVRQIERGIRVLAAEYRHGFSATDFH
jgi:GntR family transcriptional regulator/MocR family aminotransferase